MSSGVVLTADVKWISFHGSYDFGYLLKILTCQPLPDEEGPFFDLLHTYFPVLYDIKFLLRNVENLRYEWTSSLNRLAEQLNVRRVGQEHQAGSDSLVTCLTFFSLVESYFDNQIDDSKYAGVVYGLGAGANQSGDLGGQDWGGNMRRTPSPEASSDYRPVSKNIHVGSYDFPHAHIAGLPAVS
jgi:CCR4-NOT transcription complex subunit 7/8